MVRVLYAHQSVGSLVIAFCLATPGKVVVRLVFPAGKLSDILIVVPPKDHAALCSSVSDVCPVRRD
jgi:hypothetical protein